MKIQSKQDDDGILNRDWLIGPVHLSTIQFPWEFGVQCILLSKALLWSGGDVCTLGDPPTSGHKSSGAGWALYGATREPKSGWLAIP